MQSIESIILVTEILGKLPYPLKVKIMKDFLLPKDKCTLCTRNFLYLNDYPFFKVVSIKFPESFTRVNNSDYQFQNYKYLKDETVSDITKELKDLKINKSYERNLLSKIFGSRLKVGEMNYYIFYRKRVETDNCFVSSHPHDDGANGTFTLNCKFKYHNCNIFEESIEIVIQGIVS